MTTNGGTIQHKRGGHRLMSAGALLFAVPLFFLIATLAAGGGSSVVRGAMILVALAGLAMIVTGYAWRLLAAVEHNRA